MTYVIKARSKDISIQIDRRKCTAYYPGVGCIDTNSTQVKQGKETSGEFWTFDTQYFAISTKARAAGSREGRRAPGMWFPGYELQKVGSWTRQWTGNARGWERKKHNSEHNVFPHFLGLVLIHRGAVPTFKKRFYLSHAKNITKHTKKTWKLHNSPNQAEWNNFNKTCLPSAW